MRKKVFSPHEGSNIGLRSYFLSLADLDISSRAVSEGLLVPASQKNSDKPLDFIALSDNFFFAVEGKNKPLSLALNEIDEVSANFKIYKAKRVKEDIYLKAQKYLRYLKSSALKTAVWGKGLAGFSNKMMKTERLMPKGSLLLKPYYEDSGLMRRNSWVALSPMEQRYVNLMRIGSPKHDFDVRSVIEHAVQQGAEFVPSYTETFENQRLRIKHLWDVYSPMTEAHIGDINYLESLLYEQGLAHAEIRNEAHKVYRASDAYVAPLSKVS